MEGSLSVICGFYCSKLNLGQTPQYYPLSSHSPQAKFRFTTTSSRRSGSGRQEDYGGSFISPRCLIKSFNPSFPPRSRISVSAAHTAVHSLAIAEEEVALNKSMGSALPNGKDEMLPKIDKSGRFCSPRAARELALSIIYAACLEGSDPVRLFDRRLNAPREPGYEFDKAFLMQYNHMSFGGPPVATDTLEEAEQLQRQLEAESILEAEVLSVPPKLVYSKLVLRLTRKLLVAVQDRWDKHVVVIDKVAPSNWKNEPVSRILEFSILHLAMSEISVLETRHQIVINEAVDLAKRFCDGAAPRIINGCLRTFLKDLQ